MTTVQPVIPMLKRGDRYETYLTSCFHHIEKQEVTENITVYEPYLSTPTTKPFTKHHPSYYKLYHDSINELLDYGSEHADYTWLLDVDIQPPPHALMTLLNHDADIAIGVTPFHNHRDIMMCGRQPRDATHGIIPRTYESLRTNIWTHEDNFAAGLYCVLIKKHVKTRIQYDGEHPGDTNYWYNTRRAGYTHVFDPTLVCGHLPQWPLQSYLDDPL